MVDLTGRITRANQAAADLCGLPLDGLVGSPLRDLPVTTVADRDGHPVTIERSPVHRALAGERVRGAQLQVVRRDGTALWVEVNSSPLTEADGRPYGALSTYVDVTDRVERDRRIRAEADRRCAPPSAWPATPATATTSSRCWWPPTARCMPARRSRHRDEYPPAMSEEEQPFRIRFAP